MRTAELLAKPPPLTNTPPFKNTLPEAPMPPPTTSAPEVMEVDAMLEPKVKLDATMFPAVKGLVPKLDTVVPPEPPEPPALLDTKDAVK